MTKFKRFFLMLPLLLLFSLAATSQNRSIEFEESKILTEVFAKAKQNNKLVFVDCYTDWCGPCKMLARDVFTVDAVADYFNQHFVSVKFNMESDEDGVANVENWQIEAYPTLLFIDPTTEQVIHRIVGGLKPEALIEEAKIATSPDGNLKSFIERYEGGEFST